MRSIPVKQYWEKAEEYRAQHGCFPDNVFNFVSVHKVENEYRLIAPLCFCFGIKRPLFEHTRFPTKALAVRHAAGIVRSNKDKKLSIVECLTFDK